MDIINKKGSGTSDQPIFMFKKFISLGIHHLANLGTLIQIGFFSYSKKYNW